MRMKKILLISIALMSVMAAGANVPDREISPSSTGSLKQINRERRVIALKTPLRTAEAPANAVEVPFTHDLGKAGTEIKNYTAVNVNNDNRKWQFGTVNGYSACMAPNETDVNDDWLFTVPIHFMPGNYVVSFEVGFMGSGATAVEMNVNLATSPTVEGAGAEIVPTTKYTEKAMTKYEHNCAIPEEGYYYIGFHCTTTQAMKGALKLANLSVREGSVTPPVQVDPPAAGELSWVLAPRGELEATVTYTAPTKTKKGDDLTEISKVEITSRWGVDKFVYENVTPGQVITIENVEMYQGINNRFTGVAYVGDTAGDMVEYKSIWCGIDTPLAPENVRLTVGADYKSATLSWDAVPETGEHGGYVDPDQITYYIFDAFGTMYDPAIATTSETSFVFTYPDITEQDFVAYQVTAGFGEYYSLDNTSNIATVGVPESLPFTESFTNGRYDRIWLTDPQSHGQQQNGTITDDYFASLFDPEDPDAPEPLKSHDGDQGFYLWLPIDENAMYGLISTRADISTAGNPVLEFWYQGKGNIIDVLVGTDCENLTIEKTINLQEAPTDDWTLARIPLDGFKNQGAVMFELRFTAAHNDDEHTWSIPVDNIRVIDLSATDVRIVAMTGQEKAKLGDELKFTAHVENLGTEAANPVAVWTVNGETINSVPVEELAANKFTDVSLDYIVPFNAPESLEVALTLTLDGDVTPDNNTAKATVAVGRASYPTVTDLSAVVNEQEVLLSWSAPVIGEPVAETVTEDFESADYTPMSISGAGNWTVFDGDGCKTYNVFRELYNPYQTSPIAFQLFDNVVANIPDTYAPDAVAHSGQRYMLAISAQSAQNDNWLISPELSGAAQTVTFYGKSFTVAWPETFEVYYSTTDNQKDSFTSKIETVSGLNADGTAPEEWTLFSLELPAGARYFAIRHTSYDTLALFIDDVTYEAAPSQPEDLAITGYHVFRNGTMLTAEPHNGTSFTDRPLEENSPEGNYEFNYTVVPVYNHGAVAESNVASVNLTYSGIDGIMTNNGATDNAVFYNLSGVKVPEQNLTKGIYIMVRGTDARKVVIP